MKNLNSNNRSKNKRRGYESLLLLLLTIALFVTATYAWFTDSAFTKGNKVFSGNMFVDVIVSEDDLVKQMEDHGLNEEQINTILKDANLSKIKYVRKYSNGGQDVKLPSLKDRHGVNDTYYRISAMSYDDLETLFGFVPSAVDIYNIEPGQYRSLTVNYLNNGDLAFKAAGAIKLQYEEDGSLSSHNGLETLNEQYFGNYLTYKNNYQITEPHISTLDQIKRANTIVSSTEANATTISINGVDCKVVDYVDANGKYSYEEGYDNNPVKAYMISNNYVEMLYYDDVANHFKYPDTTFCITINNVNDTLYDITKKLYDSGFVIENECNYYYYDKEILNEPADFAPFYAAHSSEFSCQPYKTYFAPINYMVAVQKLDKFNSVTSQADNMSGYLYTDFIYQVDNTLDDISNPVAYAFCIENNGTSNVISTETLNKSGVCYIRPTFYVSLLNSSPVTPEEEVVGPVESLRSADPILPSEDSKDDRTYNLIDPKTIYEDTTDSYYSLDNNYLLDENEHITSENYSKYEKYIHDFDKLVKMLHAEKIDEAVEGAIEKRIYTKNDDHYEYDHSEYYKVSESINLEKVLEVYATNDADEILEKGKTSKYYFGTVSQFDYLTTYGPSADKTLSEATEIDDDSDSPDNYYKILKADATANLYADYQRYLACGSGYCLPKDVLTNDGITIKDGVNVKIYSKNVNDEIASEILEGVKEIGSTDLTVYMPTDVDSRYQNASIELQVGVTATQVGYEADDLGIMLYDGLESTDIENDSNIKKGDIVGLSLGNNTSKGLVLSVNNNVAEIAIASPKVGLYATPTYGILNNKQKFDNGNYSIFYENSLYYQTGNTLLKQISKTNKDLLEALNDIEYHQVMYQPGKRKIELQSNEEQLKAAVGDIYYFNDGNLPSSIPYEVVDTHYNDSLYLKVRPLTFEDVVNYTGHGSSSDPLTISDFKTIAEKFNVSSYIFGDALSAGSLSGEFAIPCLCVDTNDSFRCLKQVPSCDTGIGNSINCNYVYVFDVNLNKYSGFEKVDDGKEDEPTSEVVCLIYDDYSMFKNRFFDGIVTYDINTLSSDNIDNILSSNVILDISSSNYEILSSIASSSKVNNIYVLNTYNYEHNRKYNKFYKIGGPEIAEFILNKYLTEYTTNDYGVVALPKLRNSSELNDFFNEFSSTYSNKVLDYSFTYVEPPKVTNKGDIATFLWNMYAEHAKLPHCMIFETMDSFNVTNECLAANYSEQEKYNEFMNSFKSSKSIVIDMAVPVNSDIATFEKYLNDGFVNLHFVYKNDLILPFIMDVINGESALCNINDYLVCLPKELN